jgi:hypothetical protein
MPTANEGAFQAHGLLRKLMSAIPARRGGSALALYGAGLTVVRHRPRHLREAIMFKITLIAAATVLVLAGCARTREVIVTTPQPAPAQPVIVQQAPAQPTIVVDVAPPPPQSESVPPTPYSGAAWIPGYWNYANGQHTWVPGRWERPREGHVWIPARWENVNGRWHLMGGAWVRQ